MSRGRTASGLIRATIGAFLLSGVAWGQTELFEFQEFGSPSAQCCGFVGSAGDFDGDGFNDVLVSGSGRPVVHSGRDGSILRYIDWVGPFAVALGDVNGDSVTDFLAGGRVNAFTCNQPAVCSGATGIQLYSFAACPDQLLATPDLNGDTIPDFCLLDGSQVRARSGVNGSPLWNTSVSDSLLCIASLGADVTGDGVSEIVVGGATSPPNPVPFVRLLSGASGALIWGVPFAGSASVEGVAVLDDMNGNLVPDLAAIRVGVVNLLDGLDGALIRSFAATSSRVVASAGDIDGDGIEDVLLGDSGAMNQVGTSTGAVHVYSGATGAHLWTAFGETLAEGFGSSVSGLGDITGDGIPDVVAGTSNGGAARVLSGALLPHGLTLSVGVGCSPAGVPPSLTASQPVIGETFTIFVTGAYAQAPAFALFSPIPASPMTLPNGCTFYTQLSSSVRLGTGATSPSGTWVLNTPVPYAPSLIGLELALQAKVRGLPRYQLTNGLHLLVGL